MKTCVEPLLWLGLILCSSLSAPGLEQQFRATAGSRQLAGTYLADPTKIQALALLISGSGLSNRNGSTSDEGLLKQLANALLPYGVASIRIDKRGTGQSSGSILDTSIEDRAYDINTCIDACVQQHLNEGKPIFVIGHSEGGLVAMSVLASRQDIHRAIMLCTPAVPGSELILDQNIDAARRRGATREEVALTCAFTLTIAQIVGTEKDVHLLRLKLQTLDFPLAPEESAQAKPGLIRLFSSPWYRSVLRFSPAEMAAKINGQTYFIYAGKDSQINPAKNAAAARSLPTMGIVVETIPEMNHSLIDISNAKSAKPGETCRTLVLKIVSWLATPSEDFPGISVAKN